MGISVDKLLVEGGGSGGEELKSKEDLLWAMGALLLLLLPLHQHTNHRFVHCHIDLL